MAALCQLRTGHPQRGHTTFQRARAGLSREGGEWAELGGGGRGEACRADDVGDWAVSSPTCPLSVPRQSAGVGVEVGVWLATAICEYTQAASIQMHGVTITADCTKLACSHSRQQTHCIDSDLNMNRI